MEELDDGQLLRAYAQDGSEAAFEAIVRRHVSLVYSAALRQVGDHARAGDVTQTVFILLARKAKSLPREVLLSGWLYRTTQYTALRALRTDHRRRENERKAALMNTDADPPTEAVWELIAPWLDEGMAKLSEADRNALLLRFFENKSLREVGLFLGTSEDTTHKRVTRAVAKLRKFFAQRGIVLSPAVIPAALTSHAIQAAPAGVAQAALASAGAKGASAVAGASALLRETLHYLTWLQIKNVVVLGTGVLLAAAVSSFATHEMVQSRENYYLGRPLAYWLSGYDSAPGTAEWKEADAAVQRIGPDSIPELLRMFEENDAMLRQASDQTVAWNRVSDASGDVPNTNLPHSSALRHRLEAAFAFQALGASARGAVPDLILHFQKNYGQSVPLHDGILQAIGGIGPSASNAVPVLVDAFPRLSEPDQLNILQELRKIHGHPERARPFLVDTARQGSDPVRPAAIRALVQYAMDDAGALQDLRGLSLDPGLPEQEHQFILQELQMMASSRGPN